MMLNGGNVDVDEAKWGSLVALKAHTLPFSTNIATEGSKSSLENQKVLKAAHGAGTYCLHNFRHSQRSASILRY